MDIHKPKPWHNVREFLKEYVIIVVGVLTALGAETGVEWLHWRHQVDMAQTLLKADYLRILEHAGQVDAESPCLAARLHILDEAIARAGASGRLPPLGVIGRPTRDPWKVVAWSAVGSQALSHLPLETARLEASVASTTDYLSALRDDELAQWTELESLQGSGRAVTTDEIAGYRKASARAAHQAGIVRTFADIIAGYVLKTGVVGKAEAEHAWRKGLDKAGRLPVCGPIGAPAPTIPAPEPDLVRPPSWPPGPQ